MYAYDLPWEVRAMFIFEKTCLLFYVVLLLFFSLNLLFFETLSVELSTKLPVAGDVMQLEHGLLAE
jgi:hypothetical protein